ncbi:BrnT family toxin [Jiella avicenniae]|uniref:BrnT family toxin n=1 Tax=Jiella avicenniae TaxID=2907202 RepID=A0A9X1T6M9_9HYPH|nr:BrnT family toxin [Jiella avicenniae]MCE7030387.1 BrnT family toxin [Jiella avicenniae]
MSIVRTPRYFEWDDDKAAQVEALRGIAFQLAAGVFLDPNRLDMIDDRRDYGEERRITIGSASGIVLAVVYTMRGDTCRIVTAWPASRKQRKAYHGDV